MGNREPPDVGAGDQTTAPASTARVLRHWTADQALRGGILV